MKIIHSLCHQRMQIPNNWQGSYKPFNNVGDLVRIETKPMKAVPLYSILRINLQGYEWHSLGFHHSPHLSDLHLLCSFPVCITQ